jgi:hypothetical protein
MAEISTRNKVIIAVTATVAGMILLGGAAAAAAAVVLHHRWDREWSCWEEWCGECEAHGDALAERNESEFDLYCREVMGDLADTLDLSAAELERELAGGTKIMDIAGGKGISLETMVDSVAGTAGRILEREVEQGDLDAGTAQAIEDEVVDYATWFLQNDNLLLLREYSRRH